MNRFGLMCQNLMDIDEFEELFLKHLEDVANDRVRTVRLVIAKVIKKHIKK